MSAWARRFRGFGANGWTPGLYAVLRASFGLYLGVHLLQLFPYAPELFSSAGMLPEASLSPFGVFPSPLAVLDSPIAVQLVLALGVGLAGALALGAGDRAAALGLWLIWTSLFHRNPLIANPSLPYVGWLLLAHAALPRRPYGSWGARAPGSENAHWCVPAPIFAAAWIALALGYSYSGYTKLVSPSWMDGSALARVLENPLARPGVLRDALRELPAELLQGASFGALALELCFAPLALVRRLRPWLWLALLGMHAGLIALIDFADLSLGMMLMHGFTFDPAWIRPRAQGAPPARVYYDGDCGLCHGAVRFLLAEDRGGRALRFAPLSGELAAERLRAALREGTPESWVVETASGELLTRSRALLHVAARLGGAWRALGWLAGPLPAAWLDALYSRVARSRRRAPAGRCPLVCARHRRRFDP